MSAFLDARDFSEAAKSHVPAHAQAVCVNNDLCTGMVSRCQLYGDKRNAAMDCELADSSGRCEPFHLFEYPYCCEKKAASGGDCGNGGGYLDDHARAFAKIRCAVGVPAIIGATEPWRQHSKKTGAFP